MGPRRLPRDKDALTRVVDGLRRHGLDVQQAPTLYLPGLDRLAHRAWPSHGHL
jgi:hypothetical protein